MKYLQKCCVLILAVTIAAIALRLPRLEQRPMHGDEAVHAVKFGSLLEHGLYRYDSNEYHGPTLNYFTLIPAWLTSAARLTDVSELTLRIVPVFFGILLVLLVFLLAGGLSWPAVIVAAALTSISPAMVFYSRYYIQEMLLVCFTFGAIVSGYRYSQSKTVKWAILTGIFLGLMHATKETWVIVFGSMLIALFLMLFTSYLQGESISNIIKVIRPRHLGAAALTAAAVSALFYSSFFTNPHGILDSLLTFKTYFNRASQNQLHFHPWYYYLKILLYSRYASGPVWSEGLIVILAAAGFIVAITRKGAAGINFHLLRFIAFYTIVMIVLYSVVPYKTPWCLVGFLHGMILLAGVGTIAVLKLTRSVLPRTLVILILLIGGAHLIWQAYLANYKYFADPVNPYVYAHPSRDVFTITRRIEEIAEVHPDRKNMYIQVICPESDYWPLPWYLRSFPNVGWWDHVDENTPPAPLIIISATLAPQLTMKLYELPPPGEKNLYLPLFDSYTELRPQVELLGFLTKDLWDSYQLHKSELVHD